MVIVHLVPSGESKIFTVFRVRHTVVIHSLPLRATYPYIGFFHSIFLKLFKGQLASVIRASQIVYVIRIFHKILDASFQIFAALSVIFVSNEKTMPSLFSPSV